MMEPSIRQYLQRAEEIIGERTKAEKAYDAAVLRALASGKDIRAAIDLANAAHPDEAMTVADNQLADVAAHYEYQAEHANILRKLAIANGTGQHRQKPKGNLAAARDKRKRKKRRR